MGENLAVPGRLSVRTPMQWTGDDHVLAHQCVWDGSCVVAVHNLSAEPRPVTVPLPEAGDVDRVVDLYAEAEPVGPLERPRLDVKLEGHGYRSYRLQRRRTNTAP